MYEIEFDFEVVLTEVLERDAEFLDAARVLNANGTTYSYMAIDALSPSKVFELVSMGS